MDKFPSSKNLCSWAGLTPLCNESANKKSSKVLKAGCYLKPLLLQCATAVAINPKHPEFYNRYMLIKSRRGHKQAIVAVTRMLLTALYHMLKKGTPYDPTLYAKSVKQFQKRKSH